MSAIAIWYPVCDLLGTDDPWEGRPRKTRQQTNMSGRLCLFNSSLDNRDQLVEVLLFTPDSPFLLGVVPVLVVFDHLPVTGDILGLLVITSVKVDPSCLSGKAETITGRWSSDGRLGRSGLGHLDLSTDVSDRSHEVGVVGNGVVVLGGNGDRSSGPVWGGVSTTSVLLLWALARDLEQFGGLGNDFLGTNDLDDICGLDTFKVGGILDLANGSVLPGAREVNTIISTSSRSHMAEEHSRGTGLALQVLQGRSASTDFGSMLCLGHGNTDNDGLLQDIDLLLELGLDLVDELRITTKSNLDGSSVSTFSREGDQTSLLERLGRSTGIDNDLSEVATTLTNEGSVLIGQQMPIQSKGDSRI